MDNLIFAILKEFPFRNEIGSFKYFTLKDFNKQKLKVNSIVIGSKRMFFFRNNYKTHKSFGDIINNITNTKLKNKIKKYIKTNEINSGDFIFTNNKNEAYSNDAISLRLANTSNKFINVKLSTSSIFKILLANKSGSTKEITDYINIMSKMRPTDSTTVIDNYVY